MSDYDGEEKRINGPGRRKRDKQCVDCYNRMVEMDKELKRKVPIWVLLVLIGIVGATFNFIIRYEDNQTSKTFKAVETHIRKSDATLKEMHDTISVIDFRQRLVMQQLKIPGYSTPHQSR